MTAKLIALLLVAVSAGSGVSYAAEGSLPGDALYPIKVHLNENVRVAVSLSAESRARWEARRIERRLEEAEELAAQGRLSAEVRTQIEENFQAHASRVEEKIAELNTKSNASASADISARLETSLRAHERILTQLSEEKQNSKTEINVLMLRVNTTASTAAKARADAEAKITASARSDVKVAAEGKRDAAENKIREVRAFIENAKARLGAEATADAEAKVTLADKAVADGTAKLDAGAYGDAFLLFQEALRIAQDAKLLVEASQNFNIRINIGNRLNGLNTEIRGESTTTINHPDNNHRNENNDKNEIKVNSNGNVYIGL